MPEVLVDPGALSKELESSVRHRIGFKGASRASASARSVSDGREDLVRPGPV